jgi:delta-1-pyrroline-5-carboxylate synthetase
MVKLGSTVITRKDGCGLALGRLASIIEQMSWLHTNGKELIMVTSGAVAYGRQRLRQEQLLSRTVRSTLAPVNSDMLMIPPAESQSCAAVGQAGLMSLYETMFAQYGTSCAQVIYELFIVYCLF